MILVIWETAEYWPERAKSAAIQALAITGFRLFRRFARVLDSVDSSRAEPEAR
jgi:hypothetical protein